MAEPRLRIVAFKHHHLEELQLGPDQGDKPHEILTDAVTFIFQEKPIAIIGWGLLLPGVLQVWSLLSPGIKETPLSFHRSVLLLISHAFEKYELRRMQMSVRCGFTEAWNWAKALGFECEGVMRNYGIDGSPCWLFSRIP